jgi:hypothetical protein
MKHTPAPEAVIKKLSIAGEYLNRAKEYEQLFKNESWKRCPDKYFLGMAEQQYRISAVYRREAEQLMAGGAA